MRILPIAVLTALFSLPALADHVIRIEYTEVPYQRPYPFLQLGDAKYYPPGLTATEQSITYGANWALRFGFLFAP